MRSRASLLYFSLWFCFLCFKWKMIILLFNGIRNAIDKKTRSLCTIAAWSRTVWKNEAALRDGGGILWILLNLNFNLQPRYIYIIFLSSHFQFLRSLFFVYEMQVYANKYVFVWNWVRFMVFRRDQLVVWKSPNAIDFFLLLLFFFLLFCDSIT